MSETITFCPSCGVRIGKARSLPDNRRIFGIIRKAFPQWPHDHDFQPESEEQLRAFLLVEAGYHEVHHIPFTEECIGNPAIVSLLRVAVEATLAAVSRRSGYARTRVSVGGIEILTPRSISFATLNQKQFNPIRDAITEIIENAIGVSVDELLRQEAA